MPEVSVSRWIDVPPRRAWKVVATYDQWTDWGVSITDVEAPGDVVTQGATGRVRTIGGVWLPFEILDVEEGRSWTWSVAGIPATGHEVVGEEDGVRVVFTAPGWAPFYRPVLVRALERIAEIA